MLYVQVRFKFIFGFECHITFCLADFIRANMVSLCKVAFKVFVLFIENVLVLVATEMTYQVISINMVEEGKVIEEELLAEVTIRVR